MEGDQAEVQPSPTEQGAGVLPEAEAAPPSPVGPEAKATVTVEQAWAQAAEQRNQESTEGKQPEGEKPAGEPPEGDAAKDEAEAAGEAGKPEKTSQQVIDRIYSLVAQGREEELSPAERGVLNKIRQDAERRGREAAIKEQGEEQTFRDMFLALDAQAKEDPANFVKMLQEEPDGARKLSFYQAYKEAHPGVSVDNPDAPVGPNRAAVERETYQKVFDRFGQEVDRVAAKAGVTADALATLFENAKDPWSYLEGAVDAAIASAVERERPKIAAEERRAAELEAQAKYGTQRIITPRTVNGSAVAPREGLDRSPSEGIKIEDAFREATRRLAAS